MPSTIYDYYKTQGKAAPPPSQRFSDPAFAAAAAKAGVSQTDYLKAGSNNADYNNRIVAALSGDTGKAPGDISGKMETADTQGTDATGPLGDLANLRLALRSALNEGTKARTAARFQQIGDTGATSTPGTIGSIVNLLKGSGQNDAVTIFDDAISTLNKQQELKSKEMDQVNQLRAQYGSLVPAGVTDLSQALDLIAPAVDKENQLKIAALKKQINGGEGGGTFSGVPLKSTSTTAVLNGVALLSSLTPTEQTKVREDLDKLGFGQESPPEWYTKELSTATRSSLIPQVVQTKWSETRAKVLFGSSSIDESFFTKLYGAKEGPKIWGQSKGVISAYHDAGFDDAAILKLMQAK